MSIQISAVGTIATHPKLLNSENRAAFCTFRVACNDRRYDREQARWVDGDTNWLTVNAFRTLAEHAHESFSRGDRIVLTGRLRIREWENGVKSGISVEVDADALGHDLRWGVSSFSKRSVPAPATTPEAEGSKPPSGESSAQGEESRSGTGQSDAPQNASAMGNAASFTPAEPPSAASDGWPAASAPIVSSAPHTSSALQEAAA